MFLKLTDLFQNKKVLVNMDFAAVIIRSASGGCLITWREPDLDALEVKEPLETIENLLAGDRER